MLLSIIITLLIVIIVILSIKLLQEQKRVDDLQVSIAIKRAEIIALRGEKDKLLEQIYNLQEKAAKKKTTTRKTTATKKTSTAKKTTTKKKEEKK